MLKYRDSDIYRVAGNQHHSNQQYHRAVLSYSRAISSCQDLDEAYASWANSLRLLKKYEEAKAKARKAIQLYPLNVRAYRILGLTFENEGRYEEAEATFRNAIEVLPGNSRAHFCLATLLDDRERYEEAEAEYAEAASLDPYDFDIYYMWAVVLYNQLKYRDAAFKFAEAAALDQTSVDAVVSYGLILRHLDDEVGESGMYRIAIELMGNELEKLEKVIGVYEAEIEKSNKWLAKITDNEARKKHLGREIEGMTKFIGKAQDELRRLKELAENGENEDRVDRE